MREKTEKATFFSFYLFYVSVLEKQVRKRLM